MRQANRRGELFKVVDFHAAMSELIGSRDFWFGTSGWIAFLIYLMATVP